MPKFTPLVSSVTVRVPPFLHTSSTSRVLVGGEAVGHLLGEALDGAGREDMRRVALDELADEAGAEWIAMDVERGRAGAVFERLFVTLEAAARIGAGDADRRMVEPLAAAAQVGARHARIALAAPDVGAAAVEGVERRGKQLVSDLERFGEALADRQGIQIGLVDVLAGRGVDVRDVGEIGDDRPRRDAGEENAGGEEERATAERTERMGRDIHATLSLGGGRARAHNSPVVTDGKHPPARRRDSCRREKYSQGGRHFRRVVRSGVKLVGERKGFLPLTTSFP